MLNNRLEDLIILYKHYRIKQFFKNLLFLVFILSLFIGGYFIYKTLSTINDSKRKVLNVTKNIKKEKNVKKDLNISKETLKNEKSKLIKKALDNNQTFKKIEKKNKPKILKKEKIKAKELPKIDEEKAMKKNTFKALMLIERLRPSYQSALDLAKYYYQHKNYNLSAKWAVIASNREPKYEDAWLIYAKSKIKLNQKGIAKKSLKIYLLKYHSQKIKNLLNSL